MVTTPDFLPANKTLTPELVATLPKICLQSRGDLSTILAQAKERHLIYVEHITTTEDVQQLAELAAESDIVVGFLIDCTTEADFAAIIDNPTGLIVGAIAHTPEMAAMLRNALVPYVYYGPVLEQVVYAAARITNALDVVDDFQLTDDAEIVPTGAASFILDRQLPLLCQPAEDLKQEKIEIMADHPLVLLESMNFNVALDDLTWEVIEATELEIDQYYRLLLGALAASFLPMQVRTALIEQIIEPAFAALIDAEPTPEPAETPKPPTATITPADVAGVDPALLEEMGISLSDLGLDEPDEN
ncbi:MAG: hypothetical protein Q4A82_00625 [Corynebacterium sp.]|nr:hypothetical protein [Corynebacterium sp.]